MKKNSVLRFSVSPFFISLALLLFVVQSMLGVVTPSTAASSVNDDAALAISACDYCAFLNKTAAADPDHLYNWKMADGSWKILRSGAPGNYQYVLITSAAFLNRDDFLE